MGAPYPPYIKKKFVPTPPRRIKKTDFLILFINIKHKHNKLIKIKFNIIINNQMSLGFGYQGGFRVRQPKAVTTPNPSQVFN